MSSNDERTIWCGNLSEKVTEAILYELFYQVGPLDRVCIPKSRNGRGGNYGFVTFSHACSIDYALKIFDGTCLYGQKIVMKPRQGANSNSSEPIDPFATSRDDFIRGVQIYKGTNNSIFNNPLTNSIRTCGYVDKSMLPTIDKEHTNLKRRYELLSPMNDRYDRDRLKSTVNQVYNQSEMSYEAFMNLGQQMFSATNMLPISSVQNSYYGTPLYAQYDNKQNERRESYKSSNNYKSHQKPDYRRNHDRHNRRH